MSDQKTTRPLSGQLVPGGGYAPLGIPNAPTVVHSMNNGTSAAPGNPIVEHVSLWVGNTSIANPINIVVSVDNSAPPFVVTVPIGQIVQVFDRLPLLRANGGSLTGDIVLQCGTIGETGVAFGHYTVG